MKDNFSDPELLRAIAEEVSVAIVGFDKNENCAFINKMALDLLEIPLDFENNQLKLSKLFPKPQQPSKIHALNRETLDLQGLIQEILIKKWNDQIFIGSLGIKHITVRDQSLHLLMIQDVTFQKKLQREISEKQSAIHQAYQDLLSQNRQLKELDAAKNRFIAVTTHELRTPLSAIVASAEILKTNLYDNQTQHDEFINMIYDQGQQMLNLVNDILDFAKIQANKMDYYIEQKDLVAIARAETEGLQNMAKTSKVQLEFASDKIVSQCYFDQIRTKQVLTNLINNAIKYNRPNGNVKVHVHETKKNVIVSVHDTGLGISEDDKAIIFNEFETLGKVAHHAKGTGLGLSISRRMAQSMAGDLKFESEIGKGSHFWVELPKEKLLENSLYRSRPDDSGSGDLAA